MRILVYEIFWCVGTMLESFQQKYLIMGLPSTFRKSSTLQRTLIFLSNGLLLRCLVHCKVVSPITEFGKFSFTSDVWSFGILVWELMSNGKNPFIDVVEPSTTVQYILATKLPRKPDNCSDVLWNIFWSFSRLLPHIF